MHEVTNILTFDCQHNFSATYHNLKTHFLFLFAFTAVGFVQCGGRKTSPPTSTIVKYIFYF